MILPSVTSAAGDRADARGPEQLLDLGLAERLLDLLGLQHPLHRRAEVLGDLVDHRVGADLDPLALGRPAGIGQRPDVEADDDRVGGRREHHVGLGDPARRGVDHVDHDLLLRNLGDLVLKRLERARDVRLEHDVELLELALGALREDLVEADLAGLLAGQRLGLQALAALLRELSRSSLVLHRLDPLAGLADAVEPQHLDRIARVRLLHARPREVEHRPHLAPVRAGDQRIADVKRAPLDQHGGHRARARDRGATRSRRPTPGPSGSPSAPRARRPGRSSRAGCRAPPWSSRRRRRRSSRRPSPRA